ncbi:MAG: VWA domain-containing protein, partial [Chlamydiales bacterium]
MHFTIDWTAFSILCLALPLIGLIKSRFIAKAQTPSLGFSHVQGFEPSPPNWRLRWLTLPKWLYRASLVSFLFAFLDPHFTAIREAVPTSSHPGARTTIPTEGIAIYLVLDQSGSMAEEVQTQNSRGGRQYIPKIDLLKQVTEQFIDDRPNDLIGLISFARVPQVLVPLTLDRPLLIKALQQLNVVKNPQEDGTAIGYAIFKAASLITATRHYAEEL